jgi:hypothetical protein
MMRKGRACTVCQHPKRFEVEKGLVEGQSYRVLAGRFGLSRSALGRHQQAHLPAHLAHALQTDEARRVAKLTGHRDGLQAEDTRQALDVVQQLRIINSACLEVLKNAREARRDDTLLQAVDRIHRQIELQAKLLGELQDGQTVNVLVAPEWHEVRAVVIGALGPYPEARLAVAKALEGMPGAR